MTAVIHPLFFWSFCPFANCFLDTTLPLLLSIKSFFVRPPLVYVLVPFQTLRKDPVSIFLVTRFAFFTRRTAFFDALGARGLVAFAAFGALGLAALLALRAARRVARRAARFLADLGLVARRTALAAVAEEVAAMAEAVEVDTAVA